MTGSNKIRIVIILFIFGVSLVSCVKERKDCCIIFWDDNPNLSIEYLDTADYLKCIKTFPDYVKVKFSEVERFDQDCQVFVLKKEIDKDRYQRIAKHGQLYVSIVIDDKIVLNGINEFVVSTISPSSIPPKIEPQKYLIGVSSKKCIIISDDLLWEDFAKRDSLSKDLKILISKKVKYPHI